MDYRWILPVFFFVPVAKAEPHVFGSVISAGSNVGLFALANVSKDSDSGNPLLGPISATGGSFTRIAQSATRAGTSTAFEMAMAAERARAQLAKNQITPQPIEPRPPAIDSTVTGWGGDRPLAPARDAYPTTTQEPVPSPVVGPPEHQQRAIDKNPTEQALAQNPPEQDGNPTDATISARSRAFDALSALLDNDSRQSESRGLSLTERLERAIAREMIRPAIERGLASRTSGASHRRTIAQNSLAPSKAQTPPDVLPTSLSPGLAVTAASSSKEPRLDPLAAPSTGVKKAPLSLSAPSDTKKAGTALGSPVIPSNTFAGPLKPVDVFGGSQKASLSLLEDSPNPPTAAETTTDETLASDESEPDPATTATPFYATNGPSLSALLTWIRSQLLALQDEPQLTETTSSTAPLAPEAPSLEMPGPVFSWIQESSNRATAAIVEKTGLTEAQASTLYRLALATASAATAAYIAWLWLAVAATFLGHFGTTSSRGRSVLWVLRSSRRCSQQKRGQTLPTL